MRKQKNNQRAIVPAFLSKKKTGDVEEYADIKGEPRLVFDSDKDIYLIEGESNMLHAREFYTELLVWLGMFGKHTIKNKALHVRLYDFNASSALYLSKIFEVWVNLDPKNIILWHFRPDDEWEKESGELFGDILTKQFELYPDIEMPYRKRSGTEQLV